MRMIVQSLLILGLSLSGSLAWSAKSKTKMLPEKKSESVKTDLKSEGASQSNKDIRNSEDDYLSGLGETVVDEEEGEPIVLGSDMGSELDSKDESEIPIALKASKKASEDKMKPLHKMVAALGTLILFALVLFYFIHRSGKRAMMSSGARNIKILSQKSIGPKRDLMVIKVAGESVLLGVTDQNINFIKSLSILDDEMPEISPDGFSKQLAQNLVPSKELKASKAPRAVNKNAKEADVESEADAVDGYTVSKLSDVRDVVSRRFR